VEVLEEVESPSGTRRRRLLGRSTGGVQLMFYESIAALLAAARSDDPRASRQGLFCKYSNIFQFFSIDGYFHEASLFFAQN
jgi:hypothetical protein